VDVSRAASAIINNAGLSSVVLCPSLVSGDQSKLADDATGPTETNEAGKYSVVADNSNRDGVCGRRRV